jgi:hypothetical protein
LGHRARTDKERGTEHQPCWRLKHSSGGDSTDRSGRSEFAHAA